MSNRSGIANRVISRISVIFFLMVILPYAVANEHAEVDNGGADNEFPNKDTEATAGTIRNYREELNLMGYYSLDLSSLAVADLSSSTPFELKSGSRFSFVKFNESNKEYWIKVECSAIPFDRRSCAVGSDANGKSKKIADGSVFKVSSEQLADGTYTLSRALEHGVLLVPFKFRSDDGSLTAQSTIGYFAGLRSDTTLYSGTAFASAGLSVIPVTGDDGNQNNSTAFSFAFGYTFATKSNFQISLVAGVDHIGGSVGDSWQYEDDPWVSIALGYNFMKNF